MKTIINNPAIKELFLELQVGAEKHLVIEQFKVEPKQTKVNAIK